MRRPIIGLLALLAGACASTGQSPREAREGATTWRAAALASVGADLATTLAGRRSGAVEQNRLAGQRPERIVAVNALVFGAVWWFSRDLAPEQQARVWRWVTAFHVGAAAWNLTQLNR